MSIRVVHVASGREWRGGQRQVWLLARELARTAGIEQTVVTGGGSELARRLAADGVEVRPVQWKAGLDPRAIPAILRALDRRSLLHAHDAHAVTLAGMAAGLTRRPFVATRRVDFHLRRRGFWTRADRVIAISRAVADVLLTDGISPERVSIIPSGISIEDARGAERLGVRGRLGLPEETLIAANVAALVGHKDHATLLRTAEVLRDELPRLHWVIAGEGPLRAEIERLREQLGLVKHVHLLGHIPEPVQLVADADLYVMSSNQEGLGTSVLDALACGIPVASTAAGGLPELVRDGSGLLVPPGDFVALADAVRRIVADAALRTALIERGTAIVQRFTAKRMADDLVSVYRSVPHFLDGP